MQLLKLLSHELAPRPGRLENTLRITLLTILVIIISETFQIPEPAYSAYVVFFLSKEEKASTFLGAIIVLLAITLSVFSALAIYTVSVGEPGLRLPLMALIVFTGMFISRASPLGVAAFVIGFLITISLTLIDVIPPVNSKPNGEVLTESILWLWVIVTLPAIMVIIGNIVTGHHPFDLINAGLIKHLRLAGRILSSSPVRKKGKKRNAAYAKISKSGLLGYVKMVELLKKKQVQEKANKQAMLAQLIRLLTLIDGWEKLKVTEPHLIAVAAACGTQVFALAESIKEKKTRLFSYQKPILIENEHYSVTERKAFLLLASMIELISSLPGFIQEPTITLPADYPKREKQNIKRTLLAPDAFSNADYVHYALKSTLAIFIAYFSYNLLHWPGIQTCMITCFFVSLGSAGETFLKMKLRMAGALIGGGLGLATIVFIMPYLTTITGLCLIVFVVAFFAAWVATSSERLAYAGLQIALAFFVSILVGYGPSIDLTLARDRIIGILFGNLIVFIVFSTIWPVSVAVKTKMGLAVALEKLSEWLSLMSQTSNKTPQAKTDALLFALDGSLLQTQKLVSLDLFEPKHIQDGMIIVDSNLVHAVQALQLPLCILNSQEVLMSLPPAVTNELLTYYQSLSTWFHTMAQQLKQNNQYSTKAPECSSFAYRINTTDASMELQACIDWYQEFHQQVHHVEILMQRIMIQDTINQVKREAL